MSNTTDFQRTAPADRFGRAVAARLSAGADDLPYEVRERLRAARVRAVQARQQAAVQAPAAVAGRGSSATLALGGGEEKFGLWGRIASVLPILVLAAGLVVLHSFQSERRATEIAEVDAALLTDDLPPAAYADPGFVQFLKTYRE
jgi:hypothetical protein